MHPATAESILAEIEDRAAFERGLGVRVPENWPPETLIDALPIFLGQLQAEPELAGGWLTWYVVLRDDAGRGSTLVGGIGFKGRPSSEGSVEMGYSVLPQYQGRGYATEAAKGLVDWAFSHGEVTQVVAETSAQPNPSIRVLEKLGFRCIGEGEEFGTLRFLRIREA
jgi:RimJ/RimL family protein N-acetyltransferase